MHKCEQPQVITAMQPNAAICATEKAIYVKPLQTTNSSAALLDLAMHSKPRASSSNSMRLHIRLIMPCLAQQPRSSTCCGTQINSSRMHDRQIRSVGQISRKQHPPTSGGTPKRVTTTYLNCSGMAPLSRHLIVLIVQCAFHELKIPQYMHAKVCRATCNIVAQHCCSSTIIQVLCSYAEGTAQRPTLFTQSSWHPHKKTTAATTGCCLRATPCGKVLCNQSVPPGLLLHSSNCCHAASIIGAERGTKGHDATNMDAICLCVRVLWRTRYIMLNDSFTIVSRRVIMPAGSPGSAQACAAGQPPAAGAAPGCAAVAPLLPLVTAGQAAPAPGLLSESLERAAGVRSDSLGPAASTCRVQEFEHATADETFSCSS